MSGPFGATPWMYDHTDFYPLDINQSLKFNDDESQYLSWTPAASGNRKTWTWAGWVKRGNLSTSQIFFGVHDGGSQQCWLGWNSGNTIQFFSYQGSAIANVSTQAVFRDVSAWYHLVVAFDAANTTMNMYVNGVDQTLTFDTAISNTDHNINSSSYVHGLGRAGVLTGNDADMYLSDVYFIDGQAIDATYFGEFKEGIWIPKVYNGTYGNNGFHLPFKNDDTVEGFNAVTYTGTGATQSISGLGFKPDFVWIKSRDEGTSSYTGHNVVQDSVRGVGTNTALVTNETYSEAGTGYGDAVTAFNSDGFSLGARNQVNYNNDAFVAWCWDAGSGSPVSNTDGSITSTVKANPSYGFSVVSWSGSSAAGTIGHGLSAVPELIITKRRDFTTAWHVYSATLGNTNGLYLNDTIASTAFGPTWNSTSPTSSVFSVGNGDWINQGSMIAYCFHSVAGYSKISSYSGTGAAGNTITTGFRPAFLLYKRTDAGGNDWVIMDTTRSPSNPVEKRLFPNLSDAESASAGGGIDVTDTGFVINNTYANANASGGTYIYMAFADTRDAAFWRDVSGNDNNWTPVNLDYRDSLPDSTTNNFAVLNPLHRNSVVINAYASLKEGNLNAFNTAANVEAAGTLGVSSGKWYYEGRKVQSDDTSEGFGFHTNGKEAIYRGTAFFRFNGPQSSYGSTWDDGDVIGVALDLDNTSITFYKNGVSQGVAKSDLPAGTYLPYLYNRGANCSMTANFGQDSTFSGARPAGGNQDDNGIGDFAYAPPSGYLALCTANLPTSTIVDGSEYFNTVLYTGDGTSSNSITGVGFQPDFVWIKPRNLADHHRLSDSVRGVNKSLRSNLTNAEDVGANAYLGSFDSDGFTLDNSDNGWNGSSYNYAAWNWKAGGTAVSNTDGSITSQVSANTEAGFSIVTHTGTGSTATVGHGLGVKPDLIIHKNRDTVHNWKVYHSALGATKALELDQTTAAATTSSPFNNTEPTSTVMTVNNNQNNQSGDSIVSYVFANTEGYLKAGSYTGNGSTDGPFIYTGFRPAWIMWKNASSSEHWIVLDAERDPHNYVENKLYPSGNFVDQTSASTKVDYLSNGFKIRGTENEFNQSGNTIIYLAFAENPFKHSNAR